MKRLNKNGAMSMSSTMIVVLIIAIVVIGLALFFMRDKVDDVSQDFEEFSSTVSTQVVINSPVHNSIAYTGNEVSFSAQAEGTVSNYFWYVDGDDIPDHTGNSFTYIYQEPGDYTVKVNAVGPAGTAEASIVLHVYSKNLKNMNKYLNNPIFLTPATSSRGTDWENLHKLIPLAVWSEDNSLIHYSLRAYSFKTAPTSGDLNNLMKGSGFGYITESNKASVGVREHLNPQSKNAYLDFWTSVATVVVVDPGNANDALLAALFAAYNNAPLLFLDSSNLGTYQDFLKGKKIYQVGTLDGNVQSFVNSQQNTFYTSTQLKSTSVNRIVDLNAKVS